jgi:preprotein translocase subunit YajC
MLVLALLLAQTEEKTRAPGGDPFQLLFPLLPIIVIGYLLLFRPMQKEKRELAAQIAAMKKNDEVVTSGGIVGVVVSVKEKEEEVLLKVDAGNNTRIRVLKSHIIRVKKELEAGKDAPKEGGA